MVNIGASGVLVNQHNQVLLIQRDDTRTWSPPSGALEVGELPDAGVAREVREETGLIVMPVRLVAVYYIPFPDQPILGFLFRCIQRGGQIETSEESPQVGFFKSNDLPRATASFHRTRLDVAFTHQALAPIWYIQPLGWREKLLKQWLNSVVYPLKDWRRKRQGKSPYQPPQPWLTSAFTVIRDEAGAVLWVQRTDQDVWNLPGGRSVERETPWETAVRETREETGLTVTLDALRSVYVYNDQTKMVFVFTATVQSGTLTTGAEAAAFQYIEPGQEPSNSVAQHVERVADAVSEVEITQFKHQDGPELILKSEIGD